MPCLVFPLLLSCRCWVSGILAGGFPLALKDPKTFDFGFSPKAFSISHAEGKGVLNNSTIGEGSGIKGRQTSCVSASGIRKRVSIWAPTQANTAKSVWALLFPTLFSLSRYLAATEGRQMPVSSSTCGYAEDIESFSSFVPGGPGGLFSVWFVPVCPLRPP